MHGQCDVRPTVTFPAVSHYCPLTGIRFYCLAVKVVAGRQWNGRKSNPQPSTHQFIVVYRIHQKSQWRTKKIARNENARYDVSVYELVARADIA